MINLAFVGAGRMARMHANSLKAQSGYLIRGVYDPSGDALESFRKDFPFECAYGSIEELAADPSVDGVLICNYTDQHCETLQTLISAGKKQLFCEKPLVRNLADGEALLKLAEANETRIMVGHHNRYFAGFVRLKKLVDDGTLGTLRMAKVSYCFSKYARKWGDFFAEFDRSGGVTLDMMSHLFDQLNWYFGDPVSISGNSLLMNPQQPAPNDFVSGTVTYRNGVICNIDGSWQRHGRDSYRVELYGDDACAIFENGDVVHVYRTDEHTELLVGAASAYDAQMAGFLEMISKGTPPRTGLCDGFNSVRVALKLIESAKTHKTLFF